MACCKKLLAAALVLSAGAPSASRAANRPVVVMDIVDQDGSHLSPIELNDFQVSLSRTDIDKGAAAAADSYTDQISAMLDISVLSNAGWLAWLGKTTGAGAVNVKVVAGGLTTAYAMSGLSSVSLSISHSASGMDGMVSVSIVARHMTINGVTVN